MAGSLIAGIDLGVRKISVVYLKDDIIMGTTHSEVYSGFTRSEELAKVVDVALEDSHADYYFIEEPLVGRSTRVSLQVAQVAGALIYALGHRGEREVHLVSVKAWKKSVVGNGNASKAVVSDWLREHHPVYHARCGSNQDLIDAACIAVYGSELIGRAKRLGIIDGGNAWAGDNPTKPDPG
jgi:Holliday junction resolvasome RuvABC endonuclease subunit